jgi:hypothetical protein
MTIPIRRPGFRAALAAAAAVVLTGGTLTLTAAPADAAARITVRNDRGGNQADSTYQTKLTISGSGFQVVKGGFGGIYLMFGWVSDAGGGSWKPSEGGHTGDDYRYIPDAEDAADNKGYLKFIAFPGSSTASEANAILSANGGFSVDLTVPGPVFTSVDRDGNPHDVDCRKVTCGVITIGAHGVVNTSNETFTPVRFGDVYGDAEPPTETETETADPGTDTGATTGSGADTGAGSGTTSGSGSGGATPTTPSTPAKGRKPAVVVDRDTAVPGHALAFTGTGLTPGEQVLAILDDGIVALGPMVAGSSGEVAGLMQLPADLAAGTHELRLTGAASGAALSELFPVRAGEPAAAATSDTDSSDEWGAPQLFLGFAALVFVVTLVAAVLRELRRRRPRGRGRPATPPAAAPAAEVAP